MQVGDVFVSVGTSLNELITGLAQAQRISQQAGDSMERAISGRINAALKDVGNVAKQAGNDISNNISRGLRSVGNNAKQVANRMNGYFKDVSRIVSGIMISQAFYKVLQTIEAATRSIIEFNNAMQVTQVSMEHFLGSADKAKGFMQAMEDFAVKTPFNFEGLEQAAVRIKAAGFAAEEVLPVLRAVGDAVAGVGGGIEAQEGIIRALGQIRRMATVKGQELLQLANWGIDAYKYLQQELHLTGEEVANIGDQAIDSQVALRAILTGMEKEFGGLMSKISDTTPGIVESIKDSMQFIANDIFKGSLESMRLWLKDLRDSMNEARQILRTSGLGGLFEAMVPKELQEPIRLIIGSLKSLGESIARIFKAISPIVTGVLKAIAVALSAVLPIIAMVAQAFSRLLEFMLQAKPVIEALVMAFVGMKIAAVVATAVSTLARAIRSLSIAALVAKAIDMLRNSVLLLDAAMLLNPAVLAVVAGALVALAMNAKQAGEWIDWLIDKLSQLAGFDIGEVLKPSNPEDFSKYVEQYNKDIKDVIDNFGQTGKEAEKAKEKTEKFIAAFDEVFQVPEKAKEGLDFDSIFPKDDKKGPDEGGLFPPGFGSGSGGGGNGLIPKLPSTIMLPKIQWPSPPGPPAVIATDFEVQMQRILAAVPDEILLPPILAPVLVLPSIDPAFEPWRQTVRNFAELMRTELALAGLGVETFVVNSLSLLPQVQPVLATLGVSLEQLAAQVKNAVISSNGSLAEMVAAWQSQLPSINTVVSNVIAYITPAWMKALGDMLNQVKDFVKGTGLEIGKLPGIFLSVIPATVNAAISKYKEMRDTLLQYVKDAVEGIKKFWQDHKTEILLVIGAIVLAIIAWWLEIPAAVIAGFSTMVARLGPVLARIGPAFMQAIRNLPTLARGVVDDIVGWFATLPSRIGELLRQIPGFNFSFSAPKPAAVTGFANGGIIDRDSIVRVGERGRREAIVPLESSAMRPFAQAVAAELSNVMPRTNGDTSNNQPTLLVGTLIADDRSLRELERRMKVIRLSENARGVGRG